MSKKISNDHVLACAVELIRQGKELSARNLAKQLGCSTQPIYTLYKNMSELEHSLYLYIQGIHKVYIAQYADKNNMPEYKAYGMGFVKFAKIEKMLFKYIYINRPFDIYTLENDPYFVEVVRVLQNIYGVERDRALQFHYDMTIYTYGLAVIQNAELDNCMSDDEISKRLTAQFKALSKLYFEENK